MSLLSINSSFTLKLGIQSTWEWRQSATGKLNIFFKFSVLISFTSSPQECGYNFMYQSASNSLWRLKRRTWIWLIHIKVCTSKILFYILKISWGNWSILCVTNTNYHTKLTNAMVLPTRASVNEKYVKRIFHWHLPLLNITIRIEVT